MAQLNFTQTALVESWEEVAPHVKVSRWSVCRWENKGMPVGSDAHYYLGKITFRKDHKKGKPGGNEPKEDHQREEAAQLAKIKADPVGFKFRRSEELLKPAGGEAILTVHAPAYRRIPLMININSGLAQYFTDGSDDLPKKFTRLQFLETIFANASRAIDLQDFQPWYILEDETGKHLQEVGGQGSTTRSVEIQCFWNRKIVIPSKPSDSERSTTKDEDRSDNRHFCLPCPHCGGYQMLNFFQVTHAKENRL